MGQRDIARAFGLRGKQRAGLNDVLADLDHERLVGCGRRPGRDTASGLPKVTVVEVSEIDADGYVLAKPVGWRGEGPEIRFGRETGRPLAVGDRVLARLRRTEADTYEARILHRIAPRPSAFLGIFRREGGAGRLVPTDWRSRNVYVVADADSADCRPGDLTRAETLPGRHHGLPRARVVELLHRAAEGRIATIVIHGHGLPEEIPAPTAAAAAAARPLASAEERENLVSLPLVTIDDTDARDFDDAVWAEADDGGGWHAVVAIADVAWYVRPGSVLDAMALERGNSVYLPDRVLPMLPAALSNGLCSLQPDETRPCLAAHLWLDGDGDLERARFVRALMRSAARLTYDEVQAIHYGTDDGARPPEIRALITPLYGAYEALRRGRERRRTLDLDVPERKVDFGPDGAIRGIVPRRRHDSHRLIEELMIAANVAAARAIEEAGGGCLYRVHEPPLAESIAELRRTLGAMGEAWRGGGRVGDLADLARRAADSPRAAVINTLILRSQSKAVYGPDNRGHFGLNLRRYCHFTSPIRRYADLLVHRALIHRLKLGPGGGADFPRSRLAAIGDHVSARERVAAMAEREALDRFTAAWLTDRVGTVFLGRIVAIDRFGLFVALDDSGAEGLIPRRVLGHGPTSSYRLVSRHGSYVLGDPITVRLAEANPTTGSLIFALAKP